MSTSREECQVKVTIVKLRRIMLSRVDVAAKSLSKWLPEESYRRPAWTMSDRYASAFLDGIAYRIL